MNKNIFPKPTVAAINVQSPIHPNMTWTLKHEKIYRLRSCGLESFCRWWWWWQWQWQWRWKCEFQDEANQDSNKSHNKCESQGKLWTTFPISPSLHHVLQEREVRQDKLYKHFKYDSTKLHIMKIIFRVPWTLLLNPWSFFLMITTSPFFSFIWLAPLIRLLALKTKPPINLN